MSQFVQSIIYEKGTVTILDQTRLPQEERYEVIHDLAQAVEAIKQLRVRGAPAISLFGGFVLVQEAFRTTGSLDEVKQKLLTVSTDLLATRPTAVNLRNVLDELNQLIVSATTLAELPKRLEQKAIALYEADAKTSRQIGVHALELFQAGDRVLTICNAGSIATAAYGTALAPFYLAKEQDIPLSVYASETRPLLQGARLTTWELQRAGIDVTLITDNMVAHTIKEKQITAIIVGADRITRNGDTANKIGTFQLALLARAFGIPFYVAAPLSTFDLTSLSGDEIEIEERAATEVTQFSGQVTAPAGVSVFNPAFDVTPHELITAIITELGIIERPNVETIEQAIGQQII
ncbi:S-methyl-5-thioribose-1-phosphate isomerase [Exiguobacterium oxidotolerans]|uniref:Methylthioribose-1-phosphate isomerase n=1 Tax=Exiguobacterium oxidotolerans TaxID=223958 RepID=A0A653I4A6_9BACL|nr:S-methyl-5-thioribose-1-phosphate isomerase [Exiguobacterium oxidotolerans]VWX33711.1 methylthioribose-1-phosphate isomerase (methionine salvage pathway) [Exiguobacterium oxidotolerans]